MGGMHVYNSTVPCSNLLTAGLVHRLLCLRHIPSEPVPCFSHTQDWSSLYEWWRWWHKPAHKSERRVSTFHVAVARVQVLVEHDEVHSYRHVSHLLPGVFSYTLLHHNEETNTTDDQVQLSTFRSAWARSATQAPAVTTATANPCRNDRCCAPFVRHLRQHRLNDEHSYCFITKLLADLY